MLKGCKKNVVYVKNTGSELFEEAYFIVSDAAVTKCKGENDMLREASKIISGSPVSSYFPSENNESKHTKREMGKAAWFMLGVAVTAALNAIIYFII